MLNELDKELEKRGLRFTRYADDCVIVVGSEASAKRVMASITEWIERKLGLKKLGVDKDLARLTSYCGNRYYWVVTKTCVVRAISKDILKRRGLVSIYDYYMERHALKAG